MHAYAAICPHGASSLIFCTGTTALNLGYQLASKKKKAPAGGEGEEVLVLAFGVGAAEYRNISFEKRRVACIACGGEKVK